MPASPSLSTSARISSVCWPSFGAGRGASRFRALKSKGVPGTPFDFSALAREAPRPAPTVGQHTEEILADVLKLGDAGIGRLLERGVVAGPNPVE